MSAAVKSPIFSAFIVAIVLHSVALMLLQDTAWLYVTNTTKPEHTRRNVVIDLVNVSSSDFESDQTVNTGSKKTGSPVGPDTEQTPRKEAPKHHGSVRKIASQRKQVAKMDPSKHLLYREKKVKKRLNTENPKVDKVVPPNPSDALPGSKKATLIGMGTPPEKKAQHVAEWPKSAAVRQISSSQHQALLPPLLKSSQPIYPEEARWEERTGKVTLKFRISDKGSVLDPKIKKSSGHRDLDLAAIQAIQSWRFDTQTPPTSDWYYYSFRFNLD